jgi:hypothetical protein
MIAWILLAIAGAVVAQLLREVLAVGVGPLGGKLINRAADRLPEKRREIRRQEWLAEFAKLNQRGAHLLSIWFLLVVVLGAWCIRTDAYRWAIRRLTIRERCGLVSILGTVMTELALAGVAVLGLATSSRGSLLFPGTPPTATIVAENIGLCVFLLLGSISGLVLSVSAVRNVFRLLHGADKRGD